MRTSLKIPDIFIILYDVSLGICGISFQEVLVFSGINLECENFVRNGRESNFLSPYKLK